MTKFFSIIILSLNSRNFLQTILLSKLHEIPLDITKSTQIKQFVHENAYQVESKAF